MNAKYVEGVEYILSVGELETGFIKEFSDLQKEEAKELWLSEAKTRRRARAK